MNQLDVIYRALTEYRKNTKDDRECVVQRKAISTSNAQDDMVEVIHNTCNIENDWIEAIEKGLEYIEKCLKEERQFIRSNGEVEPIEKVKRVSQDSVEHLAKHSDMLTRKPEEGEDVIPDSLYVVERLADFAVYENRFLYMLLCYLRDFISIRYERIVEVTNTYTGKLHMNKVVVESNRRLEYEVNLFEEKKNDNYLKEHNEAQETIERILLIYKSVVHFLNTPLMLEVSKSPMIKPPVTRTNVLRMNKNFRQALALYEYITAYDKDGYEIITNKKVLSPFVGGVADEIAETVELSSFLTYEHGLGISNYFKSSWQKEEERRKKEEQEKHDEELKDIRKQLKNGDISPEEYILMLEKRIKELKQNQEDIENVYAIVDELTQANEKLTFKLKTSRERVNFLEDEVVRLNTKYEEDMREEKLRHEEEVRTLISEHETEINQLEQAHSEEIERLHNEYALKIEQINAEHLEEIEKLHNEYALKIDKINSDYNAQITALNEQHANEISELNSSMEQMKADYEKEIVNRNYIIAKERMDHAKEIEEHNKLHESDKLALNEKDAICLRLKDEKTLAEGRLQAIRCECGLIKPDEDFSTEAKTDELEHQYLVFKKFFKTEWKKTKKTIKKNVFAQVREDEKQRTINKEIKTEDVLLTDDSDKTPREE